MQRPTQAFETDAEGDWVARLSCGHGQHVRHKPPFVVRHWVTTPQGRDRMLGTKLDCVRCDRFELPASFVAYQRTAEFNEATIPPALRRDHSTKVGVWAKIVVLDGRLRYVVGALHGDFELSQSRHGVVVPEVAHHVEPIGPVRFYVEFYRREARDD
jgi:tellurite methyltransferase